MMNCYGKWFALVGGAIKYTVEISLGYHLDECVRCLLHVARGFHKINRI